MHACTKRVMNDNNANIQYKQIAKRYIVGNYGQIPVQLSR